MRNKLRRIATALTICCGTTGYASTLEGDTFIATFSPGYDFFNTRPARVIGNGADVRQGNFRFDFNAGPDGDIFDWQDNGGYVGSTHLVLSDLDFTDGSRLIWFSLIADGS